MTAGAFSSGGRTKRLELLIIALVACVLIGRAVIAARDEPYIVLDFRPMFCAGQALLVGRDPYNVEPLRSCEIAHGLDPRGATMPAPAPGYVLAIFRLAALLPYSVALLGFSLLSIAGLIAAAWVTARLSGISWLAALLGLFWSCAFGPLNFGQLSCLALAGLLLTAYGAHAKNWPLAAAGGALALAQPQFGFAVVMGLALWFPPARRPLAAALFVLALLSLAALGPAGNLRYFDAELPAHAASEVAWPFQFSLTWALAYAGVPEALALRCGSFSYLLLIAIGLIAARAFRRQGEDALAILSAPAFAMLGGSYVHIQQIATVIPLALILAARARRGALIPALGGALVGIDPFLRSLDLATYVACMLYALGASLRRSVRERSRLLAAIAGVALMLVLLLVGAAHLTPLDRSGEQLGPAAQATIAHAGPLASNQWKAAAEQQYRDRPIGTRLFAEKIAIWTGMVLVLGFTACAAFDPSYLGTGQRPQRTLRHDLRSRAVADVP